MFMLLLSSIFLLNNKLNPIYGLREYYTIFLHYCTKYFFWKHLFKI